jgi:hypothetical protein
MTHLWLDAPRHEAGQVVASAVLERPGDGRQELWYRLGEEQAGGLTDRADPFVVAVLLAAMRYDEPLEVHGSVDAALLDNLEELQAVWARWRPGTYRPVEIRADAEVRCPAPRHGHAIAAFSGGVDATFTVHRHVHHLAGRRSHAVGAGLLVHGFDIPLADPEAFAVTAGNARALLADVGVPLVTMATNFHELGQHWEDVFSAAVASCLMLLSGSYPVGLLGSAKPYDDLLLPWGSTPLTDPLLGGSFFRLVHDGAGFDRSQKVAALAGWAEARRRLRVCWEGPAAGRNCSRCEKCVRTILNFRAVGAGLPECFDRDVPDDEIEQLAPRTRGQLVELEQVRDAVRPRDAGRSWVASLDRALSRARQRLLAQDTPAPPALLGRARPPLSVCMVTHVAPERSAAILEPLRVLAGEVVVAVDARVDPDTLGPVRELADTLVRVEHRPPPERNFAWLHAQCTGAWLFRIDSDEVAGGALLDELLDLDALGHVTHVYLPRRWLHGSPSTFLNDLPWFPDYQPRLVRNDPALLRFPGVMHSSAVVEGPARFSESPIYHLDLLVNDVETRRRKARAYERLLPGRRAQGGLAQNAFYVPESLPGLRTMPVPAGDVVRIEAVLATPHAARAAPTGAPDPGVVPVGATDRLWEVRGLPAAAYQAALSLAGPVPTATAGQTLHLPVLVTNRGSDGWPHGEAAFPQIRLSYHLRSADGTMLMHDGLRTALPCAIAPGATETVPVAVAVPQEPGEYRLSLDLLDEDVRWFGCELDIELVVRPQRRVAIVAGTSPFRHLGDDSVVRALLLQLAEHAPEVEPVLVTPWPDVMQRRFGAAARTGLHHAVWDVIGPDGPEAPGTQNAARDRLRELEQWAAGRREGSATAAPVPAEVADFLGFLATCEALILASAGSLTSRFWIGELFPQAATAACARALGVPVLVAAVTVGPFEAAHTDVAAGLFTGVDVLTVRDRIASPDALVRLGLAPDRVAFEPDLAFALPPAPPEEAEAALAAAGVDPTRPYAVVSVHRCPAAAVARDALAALPAVLEQRGVQTVFLPHVTEEPEDDRVEHSALAAAACRAIPLLDPPPADDVARAIVRGAVLTVGTRYHLAVFAAAEGVPALGFATDRYGTAKLGGLADTHPCVHVLDRAPDAGGLAAEVDRLLSAPRGAAGRTETVTVVRWLRGAGRQAAGPSR